MDSGLLESIAALFAGGVACIVPCLCAIVLLAVVGVVIETAVAT